MKPQITTRIEELDAAVVTADTALAEAKANLAAARNAWMDCGGCCWEDEIDGVARAEEARDKVICVLNKYKKENDLD